MALSAEGRDITQLRRVLAAIPETTEGYGKWWGSADGRWLHNAILGRVGASAVKAVKKEHSADYEPGDVANTAVATLSRELVRLSVRQADDPWAYLYTVLKKDLAVQAGRYFRTDADVEDIPRRAAQNAPPPVSLRDAVARTTECLAARTPKPLILALPEAVWFFAENGQSRLSHLHTLAAKDKSLTRMGLNRNHILAIANAALGSRPNHGSNSMLAGFLTHERWDPKKSAPHRMALVKYETRMAL